MGFLATKALYLYLLESAVLNSNSQRNTQIGAKFGEVYTPITNTYKSIVSGAKSSSSKLSLLRFSKLQALLPQNNGKNPAVLTPAQLERILDEERRKKGGGGGGSRISRPYVDFSFLMMSYLSDLSRSLMKVLMNKSLENTPNGVTQSASNQPGASLGANQNKSIFTKLKIFFAQQAAKFDASLAKFANGLKADISSLAKSLSFNSLNLGVIAANILASKLFKTSSKEDEDFRSDDYAYEEENPLKKLLNVFGVDINYSDDNQNTIFSHLKNFSDALQKSLVKNIFTKFVR